MIYREESAESLLPEDVREGAGWEDGSPVHPDNAA